MANVDAVWFGVVAVILPEAALVSQPEGMNLCVVHGMRVQSDGQQGSIMGLCKGVLLFFLMMAAIGLRIVFPGIALWLPYTMKSR